MLKTKCIKSSKSDDDGLRISIMSRHTLSDGKTPDPDISHASFDEHWTELAPPPRSVGSWYRSSQNDDDWQRFEEEYRRHLEGEPQQIKLKELIDMATHQNVTVVCVESTPERCHRRLLALACQQVQPELEVEIG